MNMHASLICKIDDRGIAYVTMARPEIHNAFDDDLIAVMASSFIELSEDSSVRIIVLSGEGKSFSAGADLNWMRRMASYSNAENLADATRLAQLLALISSSPKPVIARVQGAAFGGGVGLVAACDIAIGSETSMFSLSEVRLGLIPSVISPYVIRAIGGRQSRRYMMTGERFQAEEAYRIGLLHQMTKSDGLDEAVETVVSELLKNGPEAMRECKDLISNVVDQSIDDILIAETAARIARVRASDEGREGLAAFLEKRRAAWLEKK